MNAPTPVESTFVKLSKIDVSNYIEKKGQFSYLSWPFAVSQLRQQDPSAKWEVIRFDGLPYMKTELGYFVEVAVTVAGVTLSQIHPVLDGKNRPIPAPNPFEINTAIQRCLVKAIALHGLGLNIYAGEDLPLIEDEEAKAEQEKEEQQTLTIYKAKATEGLAVLKKFHTENHKANKEYFGAFWKKYGEELKALAPKEAA